MFAFLNVWKAQRTYANSGRLLADRTLQQIGSERSDSIREIHFWMFSVFVCFQTWGRYVDFKTFFDTSRAQLRQDKPAQVKLGRVERHRPAGLIHTNTRSPACGGLYWYLKHSCLWKNTSCPFCILIIGAAAPPMQVHGKTENLGLFQRSCVYKTKNVSLLKQKSVLIEHTISFWFTKPGFEISFNWRHRYAWLTVSLSRHLTKYSSLHKKRSGS